MGLMEIRDMDKTSEYFVSTCSHINESEEIDACSKRRTAWFKKMERKGLKIKVAFFDKNPAGFLYLMPIEVSPWGPIGKGLLVIPCLYVLNKNQKNGLGKILIQEAEKEAKKQKKKGIVIFGYYWDFWFMPAAFFEKLGYKVAQKRGKEAILWKVFDFSAEVPKFLESKYEFKPIQGKVVVDLFYNTFCQTSNIEAERVKEIAKEFGNKVVLNEYGADDQKILSLYQVPRGIFIDGKEIGWGYEAPKEGIREAINQALKDG
jgi:thiol-disulfide isomerase/thioredoxin